MSHSISIKNISQTIINPCLGLSTSYNAGEAEVEKQPLPERTSRAYRKATQTITINPPRIKITSAPKNLEAQKRVDIFEETLKEIPDQVDLDTHQFMLDNTKLIGEQAPVDAPPTLRKTTLSVYRGTTFEVTQEFIHCSNPLVLAMANAYRPGGEVKRGASTQEATLCRQSNIYLALEKMQKEGKYPIPEHGGILVPQVQFFRDDEYEFVNPVVVDVFVSAPYNCRSNHKDYDRSESDKDYVEGLQRKIRTMFRIAVVNKNDTLILDAFGCDASGNDPRLIAKIYRNILNEKEFKQRFQYVFFAIHDAPNAQQENYPVFKQFLDQQRLAQEALHNLGTFGRGKHIPQPVDRSQKPLSLASERKPGPNPNDLLLRFYRGVGPNSDGLYLTEFFKWKARKLKQEQRYIQWLFPNWEESQVNQDAPALKNAPHLIDQFKNNLACMHNFQEAFWRMLDYYGLVLNANNPMSITIQPYEQNYFAPCLHWVANSTEHTRIRRILESLKNFGLEEHAGAFMGILETVASNFPKEISESTLTAWQSAGLK